MDSSKACPMAPEGQGVTFIELFFDLVFVFSITQLVGLLHHLDWVHVGQAAIVFWLVWWAWTQFTWALNAADTTHGKVEMVVLLATAVTFFMAVTLPNAFGEGRIWFGVAYVLVRLIGLGLYCWVSWHNIPQRNGVLAFARRSMFGLAAVLLGAFLGASAGSVWQYVFWGAAIAIDIWAATKASESDTWNVDAEHFIERHGLFVIIALGEGLIVAAHGLESGAWVADRILVAVLAVALVCALWWTYFTRAKPALEHVIEHTQGSRQTELLRDAFTLGHYPLMAGVVALAVAIETALTHDTAHITMGCRASLVAGIVLFQGGMGLALWRVTGTVPWMRFFWTGLAGVAIAFANPLSAHGALAIALIGASLLAWWEQQNACPNREQASTLSFDGLPSDGQSSERS